MSAGTFDDVRRARRVLCFGATGAGKSTMALALGERLGLPVTLVDELCWDPGWTQVPDAEQLRRVLPRIHDEQWVFDSLWSSHAEHAWDRIDVIVALDYPRAVSLARLIRRTIRRIRTRELVCNGNVETFPRALSRDSIIAWHVRSWASKRERMRAWHADASAPPVLLLGRPAEAEALLRQLEGAPPAS
ncbi:adenylate kinase [Agrococcus sp. ARC_14]|uniref:adenylate kinase n=1 Tax=Agrococcus sp. ARC_14 TaxID=2919927 RepID=UPI001F061E94|nr:adenylate kinase [Agrococcus sp. ARC_14]MCH1884277.1 adenylate kinase [Agrococcus sp. ARC_14]